jgi:hypothetical protein
VVQLVRYAYCKERRRSRTLVVGSCRWDLDPDAIPYGVRVADGQRLDEADYAELRRWLEEHGDPAAREARAARDRRMRAKLQAEAAEGGRGDDHPNPLADAAVMLDSAKASLAALAEDCRVSGRDVRTVLRPRYLGVMRAWEAFVTEAQRLGIAKVVKRRQG